MQAIRSWSLAIIKKDPQQELERLRNSEIHYRLLLDESMDPTFSFYPDGTYRYVNLAFANNAGRTGGASEANALRGKYSVYFEDFNRTPSAEIGPKDNLETAPNTIDHN